MKTTTIICYGDSNTYGFDPRSFLGGRYDIKNRWCNIVRENTGFNIINCGENGRTIPVSPFELRALDKNLYDNSPFDAVVVMLGSNDMLLTGTADAASTAAHMDSLITHIKEKAPDAKILLLTPPPVNIPGTAFGEKMGLLNHLYEDISKKQNIYFADTTKWGLLLSHDGVHLSEGGHHIFAENLQSILTDIMGLKQA